ncbi:MAG: DUF6157 family protein [Balneolaceae bacterium]
MKTTNYTSTFIRVSEDCPVEEAEIPPLRGGQKTAARIQYEMISENPYVYSSDDVIFRIHAEKNQIPGEDMTGDREQFFSKGRACLRSSALGKRYGWGIHSDESGKIAIYGMQSDEYRRHSTDPDLKQLKAMRSARK